MITLPQYIFIYLCLIDFAEEDVKKAHKFLTENIVSSEIFQYL